ncbi:MAG: hypothetical protein M1828_006264 [Chrysothrix sp. TS-e1954]|nr:MAG: hypothetical protein M1828_006264 [Chrysothrix sp. TS-e1954]
MRMTTPSQFKLLLFFKRNPSLSPSEFRSYYEANHVPMVMSLSASSRGLLKYTRRYLDHAGSDPSLNLPFTVFGEPVPTVNFDIVNEVTFESKEAAAEFARLLYGVEENRAKLVADEEKLFIRSEMRGMLVEEIASIE